MKQLASDVSPGAETAFSQEREDLTVDGDPRPALKEGGHRDPACERAVSGEGGHPGGQLQKSGEKPLGPLLRKA